MALVSQFMSGLSRTWEMTGMPFVKFTETGRSYAARASLSSIGVIGLHDGTRRRYGLDKYAFCVLYYDRDTKRIGIELTNNPEDPGARKITMREKTGAEIRARNFVDFFGIAVQETTVYLVAKDDSSGLLVIDMATGKKRGGGTGQKTAAKAR